MEFAGKTDITIDMPLLSDGKPVRPGDYIIEELDENEGLDYMIERVDAIIWDGERCDFVLMDMDGMMSDTRLCASIDDFYEHARHFGTKKVKR